MFSSIFQGFDVVVLTLVFPNDYNKLLKPRNAKTQYGRDTYSHVMPEQKKEAMERIKGIV